MMAELKKSIEKFLDDCRCLRGLSEKTLKAYTIRFESIFNILH